MEDGLDLFRTVLGGTKRVDELIEELAAQGRKVAEARKEFHVQRRVRMLYYRDTQGRPAGMCKELAEGDEDIALLDAEVYAGEQVLAAIREAINNEKRRVDFARECIAREWGAR